MNDREERSPLDRIADNLWSPNERDQNFEPANVVDGLFAIARGLHRIADALEDHNAE